MECYQTCVDRGNKCDFSKDKLTCIDCGRYRHGYSIPGADCARCRKQGSCRCSEFRCDCKKFNCWQWFLELLGLAQPKAQRPKSGTGDLKDKGLCASVVEEQAQEPLEIKICRSKEGYSHSIQRICSRQCACERSSRTSCEKLVEQACRDSPEKKFRYADGKPEAADESSYHVTTPKSGPEGKTESATETKAKTPEEKEKKRRGRDKSPKWTSSNSSSASRGRGRKRKHKHRSSQGSPGKSSAHNLKRENSDLSSQSRKSKGGSCSSSISSCSPIFKPYRHKYSFLKCASFSYAPKSGHTSGRCATPPPTTEAGLGHKYSRTSCPPCPISAPSTRLTENDCSSICGDKQNKEVRREICPTMSCSKNIAVCCWNPVKNSLPAVYHSPHRCATGYCKLPCRSQSFHTTMMKGPSPVASCVPNRLACCSPCDVPCGRSRRSAQKACCPVTRKSRSCPRPCLCPLRSTCCSPPPCYKSGCPKQTRQCCRTSPMQCGPCCTKACCLPCPRKFQVTPYCPKTQSFTPYASIPKCVKSSACPCPNGNCTCPTPKRKNFTTRPCCSALAKINPVCCSGFNSSYMKSRQGDAICQQLLNKYAYNKGPVRCCPPVCSGGSFCVTPCSELSTTPFKLSAYLNTGCRKSCCGTAGVSTGSAGGGKRSGCMGGLGCGSTGGGCRSCLPFTSEIGIMCMDCQNYTHSRKPLSPEENNKKKQIIEFNKSPCKKEPRCEFSLAPHCLRRTGPRSPVREYLDKLMVSPRKRSERVEKLIKQNELPVLTKQELKSPQPSAQKVSSKKKDQKTDVPAEEKAVESADENPEKPSEVNPAPSSDANASAINGVESKFGVSPQHDNLQFPRDTSPMTVLSIDSLAVGTEKSFNNNYGADSYDRRATTYTLSAPISYEFSPFRYGPGMRYDNYNMEPYGSIRRSGNTACACRDTRLSCNTFGLYAPPSNYLGTSYEIRKEMRSYHDDGYHFRINLSSNWNVNAVSKPKFRASTYIRRPENTLYKSYPKTIIYSKLESEIQQRIRQIKKMSCTPTNSTWRKQHVDDPAKMPPPYEDSSYSMKGESTSESHPVVTDFINDSWRAIKEIQKVRASEEMKIEHKKYTQKKLSIIGPPAAEYLTSDPPAFSVITSDKMIASKETGTPGANKEVENSAQRSDADVYETSNTQDVAKDETENNAVTSLGLDSETGDSLVLATPQTHELANAPAEKRKQEAEPCPRNESSVDGDGYMSPAANSKPRSNSKKETAQLECSDFRPTRAASNVNKAEGGDCQTPVFQSLLERFEETVQVFVRSKLKGDAFDICSVNKDEAACPSKDVPEWGMENRSKNQAADSSGSQNSPKSSCSRSVSCAHSQVSGGYLSGSCSACNISASLGTSSTTITLAASRSNQSQASLSNLDLAHSSETLRRNPAAFSSSNKQSSSETRRLAPETSKYLRDRNSLIGSDCSPQMYPKRFSGMESYQMKDMAAHNNRESVVEGGLHRGRHGGVISDNDSAGCFPLTRLSPVYDVNNGSCVDPVDDSQSTNIDVLIGSSVDPIKCGPDTPMIYGHSANDTFHDIAGDFESNHSLVSWSQAKLSPEGKMVETRAPHGVASELTSKGGATADPGDGAMSCVMKDFIRHYGTPV